MRMMKMRMTREVKQGTGIAKKNLVIYWFEGSVGDAASKHRPNGGVQLRKDMEGEMEERARQVATQTTERPRGDVEERRPKAIDGVGVVHRARD